MQANDVRSLTICTEKAGLAAGTTTTYTTANAVDGTIRGEFATQLSAQTNTSTPTTDGDSAAFTVISANEGSVFVFCLIAAGTIAVFQGSVETCDDAGTFTYAPEFPDIDLDTYMPFAYVIIKADSTASDWTFGASNWDATGITDTYSDISTLPDRPQTS